MSRREKNESDLQTYFSSERFRKRLDDIRASSNKSSDLKIYALSIATKLGLKTEHTGTIYDYLKTGRYRGDERVSAIQIIDKSIPEKIQAYDSDDSINLKDFGVYIELNEDTSQDELTSFINKNWTRIKTALNNNYPGRRKRFVAMNRIDNYLAIADQLNEIEEPHERAQKAKDLAVEYNFETREIYAIAKKYRSILVE